LTLHYQIIFMKRDVSEVINSQNRMISKPVASVALGGGELEKSFSLVFDEAVKFARQLPRSSVEICEHRDLLQHPLEVVERIKGFLDLEGADSSEMAAVVTPALYRARSSGPS
jgi:hypothetical protein